MHSCAHAMQAAPFFAYSSLTIRQQQTIHPRLPHPHTRARVQVLLHIASANFCVLTSEFAVHFTPLLEHKSNTPSQLELCISVGSAASWSADGLRSSWNGQSQIPDPAMASTKAY
eukprot:673765-Pelagomonas_calceolata.AAC.10